MASEPERLRPFHLAVTVDDLEAARRFYAGLLGCTEGRSSGRWIDFDLYGHQFVTHLDEGKNTQTNVRPEALSLSKGEGRNGTCSRPSTSSGRTEKETSSGRTEREASNPVDGRAVPVPHFGVVLGMEDWQALADKLRGAEIAFVIEPTVRFAGKPGEQATMFFRDPAGNALEFKAFADDAMLFASD